MEPRDDDRLISSVSDIIEASEPSVRLTVPVRPDQEELLTRIARTITQNRDRKHRSQRITKASIIRVYIDALGSLPIDTANVSDERVLLERVLEAMRERSG